MTFPILLFNQLAFSMLDIFSISQIFQILFVNLHICGSCQMVDKVKVILNIFWYCLSNMLSKKTNFRNFYLSSLHLFFWHHWSKERLQYKPQSNL
jgi:hypothetical protein